MIDPLFPVQLQAFEKLKKLRVGALYMDGWEGKTRLVAELVQYRLKNKKIEGVLWLCNKRKMEIVSSEIFRMIPQTQLVSIEGLSHSLPRFMDLLEKAQHEKLMLVIDNGLMIKNINALRTKRVIALSQECAYRLLICDMPFTKNIADMYAQWCALDWRILGYRTYWGFSINHLSDRCPDNHTAYLARAIEPYCVQILQEDLPIHSRRKEYVWQFQLPPIARQEYREVMDRFLWRAFYSPTGVYRLLQACQHVVCGRKIIQDFPLATIPLYSREEDDPRLSALQEILPHFQGKKILILCRYGHECASVLQALRRWHGYESVIPYPAMHPAAAFQRPFTVMNVFADVLAKDSLQADIIIYYSSDWNWRKRQEKEKQCLDALTDGELTIVSLAAADTIDVQILKCIWKKESLIRQMRQELSKLHQEYHTE